MKKGLMLFSVLMMVMLISTQTMANPRPWYVKIKVGFFAKWAIVMGECAPGWGICISLDDGPSQNYIGYDSEVNKLSLRIIKTSPDVKNLSSGSLEIKEDSPVDPRVIRQFPSFSRFDKIIIIKKGNYKITDDGEYYQISLEYYIQ